MSQVRNKLVITVTKVLLPLNRVTLSLYVYYNFLFLCEEPLIGMKLFKFDCIYKFCTLSDYIYYITELVLLVLSITYHLSLFSIVCCTFSKSFVIFLFFNKIILPKYRISVD